MDMENLESQYEDTGGLEVPTFTELGFKNFMELLLQLKMIDLIVLSEDTNMVEKTPANRSVFETLVRMVTELVTYCEEAGKDLRTIDLRKHFRAYHYQDIPFEKFPSITSMDQFIRSLTSQKLSQAQFL